MAEQTVRRGSARWVPALLVSLALILGACDFDGAYDLPLPGSPVDKSRSIEVTADFEDILNVVPKSPVMVSDVTVGEIVEVNRVGWNARVKMRIRDDVEIPANAIAMIRQTSLLGEKYVAIEPPIVEEATGRLRDGDHIEIDETGRNPEVEEVLGALSFLLTGGGVAQLGTITAELNLVMNGRTDRLRALLGNLESVVGTIDEQKGDIIAAMEAMNRLATTLNAERDAIGEAIDVMPAAIHVLSEQHDELVAMLGALEELGEVGTRVITASKDDLVGSLRSLRPVLDKLNEAGSSLPGGLSLMLSFPFPEEARDIVKGDYGNTEIRLDVNLDNFLTDAPLITLPDPVELLQNLTACITSGNLASVHCAMFLTNLDLFRELREACTEPVNALRDVCQLVSLLPGGQLPSLTDITGLLGLPGLPGAPGLLDLPGILGLRLTASGDTTGTAQVIDLYGTGLSS